MLSLHGFAQEKLPPPQSMQKETPVKQSRPKFTVGGGFGFQFGTLTQPTIINYNYYPYFRVGVGVDL
jgi:hypothetical protein